ncbi:MAG: hypothetical protein IIY09_02745 [Clostridia bacterium]|nr:hypothetical protein [Clostridia bacterium]
MFDATKKALDRTIEDFLFADFLRIVVSSLVYTATLLYRIVLGKLLWLYLPLLAITAIYLTEYLCFTKYGANLKMTGAKKKALCWYRWTKRIFTLAVIIITVANLVETATTVSALSVIFAVFSAVCLILQLVFELISIYIKARFSLIRDGVKEDIDEITRMAQPLIKPFRFIQRIVTGKPKKQAAEQAETDVPQLQENVLSPQDEPQESVKNPIHQQSFFARIFKKKTPPLAMTVEENVSPSMPKEEVGKDGITYLVAEYSADDEKRKRK